MLRLNSPSRFLLVLRILRVYRLYALWCTPQMFYTGCNPTAKTGSVGACSPAFVGGTEAANCSGLGDGSTPPSSGMKRGGRSNDHTWMSWSKSADGPWSEPIVVLSGEHIDANLSPVINDDGSLLGLWRGGLNATRPWSTIQRVTASHWKDPNSYKPVRNPFNLLRMPKGLRYTSGPWSSFYPMHPYLALRAVLGILCCHHAGVRGSFPTCTFDRRSSRVQRRWWKLSCCLSPLLPVSKELCMWWTRVFGRWQAVALPFHKWVGILGECNPDEWQGHGVYA
jgi:hypothetical protein